MLNSNSSLSNFGRKRTIWKRTSEGAGFPTRSTATGGACGANSILTGVAESALGSSVTGNRVAAFIRKIISSFTSLTSSFRFSSATSVGSAVRSSWAVIKLIRARRTTQFTFSHASTSSITSTADLFSSAAT
jgi:hypothetical protein